MSNLSGFWNSQTSLATMHLNSSFFPFWCLVWTSAGLTCQGLQNDRNFKCWKFGKQEFRGITGIKQVIYIIESSRRTWVIVLEQLMQTDLHSLCLSHTIAEVPDSIHLSQNNSRCLYDVIIITGHCQLYKTQTTAGLWFFLSLFFLSKSSGNTPRIFRDMFPSTV